MKRLLYLLATIACILLMTGCEAVSSISQKNPDAILNMTAEQRTEDFTYLIDTMNQLYPFWGEVKDLGVNKEELADKYNRLIADTKDDVEFLNTILDYFDELHAYSLGHLTPIPPAAYNDFVKTYKGINDRKTWYKVLTNPTTVAMYSAMDPQSTYFKLLANGDTNKEAATSAASSGKSKEAMHTDIINEGKTAYIRIPTFSKLVMNDEVPKVKQFIEANKDLDDLVIDIRGNGGGSDAYWMNALVIPNITEDKSYSKYYLYKEELLTNDRVNGYRKELYRNLKKESSSIELLPKFDKLSLYAKNFDYYTYSTNIVPAEKSTKPYNGHMWVLTDHLNGSASASFTDFCAENDFATLVGEASGGDNCNGDPSLYALPNSGLVFRFDLFYGLNPDGTCNAVSGMQPDIPCASENALEVCLAAINRQ